MLHSRCNNPILVRERSCWKSKMKQRSSCDTSMFEMRHYFSNVFFLWNGWTNECLPRHCVGAANPLRSMYNFFLGGGVNPSGCQFLSKGPTPSANPFMWRFCEHLVGGEFPAKLFFPVLSKLRFFLFWGVHRPIERSHTIAWSTWGII